MKGKKKKKIVHKDAKISKEIDGRISISFPTESKPLYLCEQCQTIGRHPINYVKNNYIIVDRSH